MIDRGAVLAFVLCAVISWPSTASALPAPFTAEDRVCVVAPHPDDEALGAGGAVQAALAAGARVKIVYLTHGDANEASSIFYFKKPLIRKKDFIKSGKIRKDEALRAMAVLGLGEEDLIFLGYPDGGLLSIWRKHWGAARPYRSFLTRINRVPYEEDFSYGRYYKGENVLRDLRSILEDLRPTRVLVTAPFDKNSDHQAAYLFTQLALLEARDRLRPELLYYVIHRPESSPGGLFLKPSSDAESGWERAELRLSEEQMVRKSGAIAEYKSQLSYRKKFLKSFAGPGEMFFVRETEGQGRVSERPVEVRYEFTAQDLIVTARLLQPIDEIGSVSFDLFPYHTGIPFEQMPKLHVRFFGKRLFLSDLSRGRSGSPAEGSVRHTLEDGLLTARVPLSRLRDPELVFVSARISKEAYTADAGAWKVLDRGVL